MESKIRYKKPFDILQTVVLSGKPGDLAAKNALIIAKWVNQIDPLMNKAGQIVMMKTGTHGKSSAPARDALLSYVEQNMLKADNDIFTKHAHAECLIPTVLLNESAWENGIYRMFEGPPVTGKSKIRVIRDCEKELDDIQEKRKRMQIENLRKHNESKAGVDFQFSSDGLSGDLKNNSQVDLTTDLQQVKHYENFGYPHEIQNARDDSQHDLLDETIHFQSPNPNYSVPISPESTICLEDSNRYNNSHVGFGHQIQRRSEQSVSKVSEERPGQKLCHYSEMLAAFQQVLMPIKDELGELKRTQFQLSDTVIDKISSNITMSQVFEKSVTDLVTKVSFDQNRKVGLVEKAHDSMMQRMLILEERLNTTEMPKDNDRTNISGKRIFDTKNKTVMARIFNEYVKGADDYRYEVIGMRRSGFLNFTVVCDSLFKVTDEEITVFEKDVGLFLGVNLIVQSKIKLSKKGHPMFSAIIDQKGDVFAKVRDLMLWKKEQIKNKIPAKVIYYSETPKKYNIDSVLRTWMDLKVITGYTTDVNGFYCITINDGLRSILETEGSESKYRSTCTKLHPRNPVQLAKLERPTIVGLRNIAKKELFPFEEELYPIPDFHKKNDAGKRVPNYISKHFLEEGDKNRTELELVTNQIASLAKSNEVISQRLQVEENAESNTVGHQPVQYQPSVESRNNNRRPITGLEYHEINFEARRFNPSLGLPPPKVDTTALLS